jgi:hypothetical protein
VRTPTTALVVGFVLALPAAAAAQEPEDLTLLEAARLALETHPSVAAAAARRDAAGAGRDEAAAAWLPDVAVDAAYTRFEEPMPVTPLHAFDLTQRPVFDRDVVVATLASRWTMFDAVSTDIRDMTTVVVDHDVTPNSRRLVDAFTASGRFRVIDRGTRSAAIVEGLEKGEAVVRLEIPAGFAADLAAGRSPIVQILVDGTNSNTGTVALGYANRIVQRFAEEAGTELAARRGFEPLPAGIDLRARA